MNTFLGKSSNTEGVELLPLHLLPTQRKLANYLPGNLPEVSLCVYMC